MSLIEHDKGCDMAIGTSDWLSGVMRRKMCGDFGGMSVVGRACHWLVNFHLRWAQLVEPREALA